MLSCRTTPWISGVANYFPQHFPQHRRGVATVRRSVYGRRELAPAVHRTARAAAAAHTDTLSVLMQERREARDKQATLSAELQQARCRHR